MALSLTLSVALLSPSQVNGVMHAIGGVSNSSSNSWGAHGSGAPAGAEPFTAEVERYDAAAREWKPCPGMVSLSLSLSLSPCLSRPRDRALSVFIYITPSLSPSFVLSLSLSLICVCAQVAPVAYHACFAAGLAPLYD